MATPRAKIKKNPWKASNYILWSTGLYRASHVVDYIKAVLHKLLYRDTTTHNREKFKSNILHKELTHSMAMTLLY
jgi:hypothetical protein